MTPWFRTPSTSEPPFQLTARINTTDYKNGHSSNDVVPFPWTRDVASIPKIWKQSGHDEEEWITMVSRFEDALVRTDKGRAYVYHSANPTHAPRCIILPTLEDTDKEVSTDYTRATWTLEPARSPHPYIILAHLRKIYVYDTVLDKVVTELQGHGGAITSLKTHPVYPNMFCSTSRDYSTRIYQLAYPPKQKPKNPIWPPNKHPSKAGAAFGLDSTEPEGSPKDGIGCCIMVLAGGRAGGHTGDVLDADFHPTLPLIATCGVDRAIKIWHYPTTLPTKAGNTLLRADKPLFSSSRIHQARVLSVAWLNAETLISHSAPFFQLVNQSLKSTTGDDDSDDSDDELSSELGPGTVCLWRWLSRERFFPTAYTSQRSNENNTANQPLRGCPSDYQESSCFSVLSVYTLPQSTDNFAPGQMSVYRHPNFDPLIFVTFPPRPASDPPSDSPSASPSAHNMIFIANVARFKPRAPRPFDPTLIKTMHHASYREYPDLASVAWRMELPEEHRAAVHLREKRKNRVTGRGKGVGNEEDTESLAFCRLVRDGRVLVGVGDQGSVWIWRDESG